MEHGKYSESRPLNVALLSFGLLTFGAESGYSWGPILAIAVLLVSAFRDGFILKATDDLKFSAVFIATFIVGIMDTFARNQPIANLENYYRYLLAAFVILYLPKNRINEWFLWMGFALGAISAGIWSVYAKAILELPRVETFELSVTHFGNFGLWYGFMSMCGLLWAAGKEAPVFKLIMVSGCALGVLASLLSGTRGGWIIAPAAFLVVYLNYQDIFAKRFYKIVLFAIPFALALLIAVPSTGISSRFTAVFDDYEQYKMGNSETSLGARVEIWRAGFEAFSEKPIFGWGEEAFYSEREQLVEQIEKTPGVDSFNHLHSQYVEELAMRGVVGLGVLLLLFLYPYWLFYQKSKSDSCRVKSMAVAGMVCVIFTAGFCLTESMLRFSSGIMVFAFSIAFLWGGLRSIENENRVSN